MGLYVKQSDTRSQLQEKLATELQERQRAKAKAADMPDGVDDSAFIKGTEQSSRSAIIWIAIIVAFIGFGIWVFVVSSN